MTLLFEALRGIFLFMTIFMIIFLSVGKNLFAPEMMWDIYSVMMPAYMVMIGLIIWYILNLIGRDGDETEEEDYRIGTTAYIQWLVIGIFLALMYIFIWV